MSQSSAARCLRDRRQHRRWLGDSTRPHTKSGTHVILAYRNQRKEAAAADCIAVEHPKGHVELALLDPADLDSVRAFSDCFAGNNYKLDLLINGAGVMMCPECSTKRGL